MIIITAVVGVSGEESGSILMIKKDETRLVLPFASHSFWLNSRNRSHGNPP